MTKYEKVRIALVIVNILITLGLPFIVVHINTKLNPQTPCRIK